MTCDVVRTRLLTLADPRRVPADVRTHVADCPACEALRAAAARTQDALARMPVPASPPGVKAAFLARVAAPEPIITRAPAAPPRPGWFDRVSWRPVAGLAAGVVAAAGVWWATSGPKVPEHATAPPPRHELLAKEVRHTVALANAATPTARVAVWADVAADIRAEVRGVYLFAPDDDMKALGAMFDKAVRDGVVKQADHLPPQLPAAERHRLLAGTADQLAATAAEANGLATAAPPQSKPVLQNIARTALAAKKRLDQLARGEGV